MIAAGAPAMLGQASFSDIGVMVTSVMWWHEVSFIIVTVRFSAGLSGSEKLEQRSTTRVVLKRALLMRSIRSTRSAVDTPCVQVLFVSSKAGPAMGRGGASKRESTARRPGEDFDLEVGT